MLRNFLIGFCLCFSISASATSISEVRIAAGVMSGTYYPVALQLCSLITKYSQITNCEVIATSGSINNLNLLATDKVDFAFVQADVAYEASKGSGIFSNQKPYVDLRVVLTLFPEVFSMIVKDEKGIINFSDITGKKIGVNIKGSGAKSGLLKLFNYFKSERQPQIVHINDTQMPLKLCDDEVDAIVLFTGHPSGVASQISATCDVEFVSIDSFKLDDLLSANPIYQKYILPAKLYTGISRNASTFATKAILTTNVDISPAKVKLLSEIVEKHFDEFKNLYPVLSLVEKDKIFVEGLIPSYPR